MARWLKELLKKTGATPEEIAELFGLGEPWEGTKRQKDKLFNILVAGTGSNQHASGKCEGETKDGENPRLGHRRARRMRPRSR
jgi:hypothetical protein